MEGGSEVMTPKGHGMENLSSSSKVLALPAPGDNNRSQKSRDFRITPSKRNHNKEVIQQRIVS